MSSLETELAIEGPEADVLFCIMEACTDMFQVATGHFGSWDGNTS